MVKVRQTSPTLDTKSAKSLDLAAPCGCCNGLYG